MIMMGQLNDLTAALNISPDIGMIWYYRGIAFSKLHKQTEAAADWAEARKLGF
jgi:hypothetical protein